MGSMLNMILIYYICIKRGCKSVIISLFKDNEHQQHYGQGLQLWSIDKCMVDTFEALEEDAVESLIDQSTSLRFVGLYHCLSSYTELYMTDSPLVCSWLLSTVIYGYYKLSSLLLKVHYKTVLPLFWHYSLLVTTEIVSVASSLKLPAKPWLSRGGNKYLWLHPLDFGNHQYLELVSRSFNRSRFNVAFEYLCIFRLNYCVY
jgi:hypothetical protein